MLVAKWPCQNSVIFSCNGRGPLAMRCSHQNFQFHGALALRALFLLLEFAAGFGIPFTRLHEAV